MVIDYSLGNGAIHEKKKTVYGKGYGIIRKSTNRAKAVQQITVACGISKGAFYLTFISKTNLKLSIIDELRKRFSLTLTI